MKENMRDIARSAAYDAAFDKGSRVGSPGRAAPTPDLPDYCPRCDTYYRFCTCDPQHLAEPEPPASGDRGRPEENA